jgi:hypothetical protein
MCFFSPVHSKTKSLHLCTLQKAKFLLTHFICTVPQKPQHTRHNKQCHNATMPQAKKARAKESKGEESRFLLKS